MLRVAARQVLARRLGYALTLGALACAALGAVAIASVSERSRSELQGGVARAWRSPFDLLVRPAAGATPLERRRGLVRPNYLSGLVGGITDAQLRQIRRVAGVEVAAPLAVIGFAEWPGEIGVPERPLLGRGPYAVLRLRATARGDAGLSRYPRLVRPDYVAVARHGTLVDRFGPGPTSEVLEVAGHRIRCATPDELGSAARPRCETDRLRIISPEGVQWYPNELRSRLALPLRLPLLVAGLDPVAEARLTGLERCLTSGRYLRSAPLREHTVHHPELVVNRIAGDWDAIDVTDVPLLASERSFLGEQVTTVADRLEGPPGAPRRWRTLTHRTESLEQIYRESLGRIGRRLLASGVLVSAGDVSYRELSPDRLQALAQPQLFSAFDNPVFADAGTGRRYAPAEAHDTWMRPVAGRQLVLSQVASSRFRLVGRYDPVCLPGFDPLAGARLDMAAPPQVTLPNGKPLLPTRSPAGYATPPPLMLTTLQGARYFADQRLYSPAPGDAYISAVRVRVHGVAQATDASRRRLAAVALEIRRRTGLRVDVVKGASTRAVAVELPAGRYGRPALTVTERWSVKGVALRFGRAIDTQNLALLAVALITALLLSGQTAHLSVRRRRREFAVLRAMGWGRRDLTRLVVTETALVGAAAGLLAGVAGFALLAAAGKSEPALALLAAPGTALLAVVAGLAPALRAGYGAVLDRLSRRARPRLSRPPRTAPGAGISALRHGWRGDALLAVLALSVGAASVGAVILVAAAFNGQLDATVLGQHLRAEAGPAQLLISCLSAIIGALVAGQVIVLSYLERRQELAALRALGWPTSAIRGFVVGQGAGLALLSAAFAAGAVALYGVAVGANSGAVVGAALATVGVTLAVGAAISAIPAALIRSSLAEALSDA